MVSQNTALRPVDQINAALRGSVIDILRHLIPSLHPYSNEEAFNVILNSPEMTSRSFRAFHENRPAFAHILQGADGQPVGNDNDPLSCGRSLTQVAALIVQAVAKRYFRKKLTQRPEAMPPAKPTLTARLAALFGARPPRQAAGRVPGAGERLFQAMRTYLLFEWQLRLIPHYVGLPLALVQKLGARILDYREIEDIRWMVRTGQILPTPSAKEILTAELPRDDTPSAAAPQARPKTMKHGVDPKRYAAAVLGRVNAAMARRVMRDLKLTPPQLAAMLVVAYEVLPVADFQRFGASSPDSLEADRFIAAAFSARFGVDTTAPAAAEFARLYAANVRRAT